jgi:DNA-binding response OmpR family regulator
MEKKQILIVEDDARIALLLLRALDSLPEERYRASICPLADVAISRMETERFDLLVTDVCMPGTNGLELARHVLRNNPQTRLMVITAFGTPEIEAVVDKLGGAYLTKPFRMKAFLSTVEQILSEPMPECETMRLANQAYPG